jgi:hypothetical protein
MLGYEVDAPRKPSVEYLMETLPDVILIDWAPDAVRSNRKLVKEIRSVSLLSDVPIGIFYSFENDLSADILGASKVFALELGTASTAERVAETLRKVTGRDWPTWPPPTKTESRSAAPPRDSTYVEESRLRELRELPRNPFDLKRLIRLAEELNAVYMMECYIATAMLVRAIADHVPPVIRGPSGNRGSIRGDCHGAMAGAGRRFRPFGGRPGASVCRDSQRLTTRLRRTCNGNN